MKNLLTIAGSDSSGGAGIQADLKTFSAIGTFGMSVITAVTAQNTQGVTKICEMDKTMVKAQIDAIFEDIVVDGVKIGMVSNVEIICQIAESLKKWDPKIVVVDPVMVSKSGHHLLKVEAKETLIKELFPIATIVTPNISEAEVIVNRRIASIDDMKLAAERIFRYGPKYILVKGGHLEGEPIDILFDGEKIKEFNGYRLNTKNTHGTGCTLSSAIAAHLAMGYDIEESIKQSKDYLTKAIEKGISLGKGVGPVHHFYNLYKKAGLMKTNEMNSG